MQPAFDQAGNQRRHQGYREDSHADHGEGAVDPERDFGASFHFELTTKNTSIDISFFVDSRGNFAIVGDLEMRWIWSELS